VNAIFGYSKKRRISGGANRKKELEPKEDSPLRNHKRQDLLKTKGELEVGDTYGGRGARLTGRLKKSLKGWCIVGGVGNMQN